MIAFQRLVRKGDLWILPVPGIGTEATLLLNTVRSHRLDDADGVGLRNVGCPPEKLLLNTAVCSHGLAFSVMYD
jgi:hypothetical protein